MRSETYHLDTSVTRLLDITGTVSEFVRTEGDGLVHAFLPHATCGLAIVEVGAGSEPDLLDAIDRLLPREDIYRHRHGSRGHGADHVLPAFVSPSLTVPVQAGQLLLGTWQSLVVVDTNVDNRVRTLRLSFVPA
jgi:secondary thiamine-phosphate synthase enzyme